MNTCLEFTQSTYSGSNLEKVLSGKVYDSELEGSSMRTRFEFGWEEPLCGRELSPASFSPLCPWGRFKLFPTERKLSSYSVGFFSPRVLAPLRRNLAEL